MVAAAPVAAGSPCVVPARRAAVENIARASLVDVVRGWLSLKVGIFLLLFFLGVVVDEDVGDGWLVVRIASEVLWKGNL